MSWLPDTNVWISLLKNPAGKLEAKMRAQATTDILLCSIVKAELWHGAEKYGNRERRLRALEGFGSELLGDFLEKVGGKRGRRGGAGAMVARFDQIESVAHKLLQRVGGFRIQPFEFLIQFMGDCGHEEDYNCKLVPATPFCAFAHLCLA